MRGEEDDTPSCSMGGDTVTRTMKGGICFTLGMLILRYPYESKVVCVTPVTLHVELRGELRKKDVG